MMKYKEIRTLGGFFKWYRNECANNTIDNRGRPLYFRGQASEVWKPIPSLARDIEKDEVEILNNAKRLAWNELQNCSSGFEKLVKLQHYGLHTRLLDVTTNPLVALYFACKESVHVESSNGRYLSNKYENGCVLFIRESKNVSFYDENFLDILFCGKKKTETYTKEEIAKILNLSIDSIDEYTKTKVIPSVYNNPRIVAQQGAFVVPPIVCKQEGDYGINYSLPKELDVFDNECLRISDCNKENILKELDLYGINERTLFPELEHVLHSIMNIH